MYNFSLALVRETKLILSDSSATSSSRSIPFATQIESVITSMKLVGPPPVDGTYIATSKALPFALWTVVSVSGDFLLRSGYASSPIAIKSKSPSKVGVSNSR